MSKLPRLPMSVALVNSDGRPTASFVRWWQEFADAIEASDTSLTNQLTLIQNSLTLASTATAAANASQSAADTAGGSTAQSGSASSVVTITGTSWITGPTVALGSVVAGSLYVTGSGPNNDSAAFGTTPYMEGEFRIVEVVGGIDTGTKYTGTWTVYEIYAGAVLISVTSSTADAITGQTSTGLVDYRLDIRKTTGPGSLSNATLYMYVRRA